MNKAGTSIKKSSFIGGVTLEGGRDFMIGDNIKSIHTERRQTNESLYNMWYTQSKQIHITDCMHY